jgi:hypothetical protein
MDEVRCPSKGLMAPGYVGSRVWNDDGSSADHDFGSWQIAPRGENGLYTGAFTGQSYPSNGGYATPSFPVFVLDERGVVRAPPLSEEAVRSLIATHSPALCLHPVDPYLPDDPVQVLNAAKLRWALVRYEGSYDHQYFEYVGEMQTSAATLMSDVAGIESGIRPYPPYGNHPDFRIWLSIPGTLIHGDLGRTRPVVHVRPRGPLTEIQFWYFYPFNGPGRVQICFAHCEYQHFNESGRHWGDWEMVSLLLDNGTHDVVAVGMSHHGNVEWTQYAHLEKHTDGVRPLVYAAINSHAHYRHAGGHFYAVVWHLGPIKATTYDITSPGPVFVVDKYYLATDEQNGLLDWLYFPYLWGQYIWNHDDVYFLSTNYFDYEEVNSGPSGPPQKPEW